MSEFPNMRAEYQHLYEVCQATPARFAELDSMAGRIGSGKPRYEAAALGMRVPWQWVGIVHLMECTLRFDRHLHNGDPLTARTRNAPVGRPPWGNPPFPWEASAKDALIFRNLHNEKDWSIPGMLFQFERWNGMAYRRRGIPSPYLWAGSQHYTAGKFLKDGEFDPKTVSKQLGAAVVLKRLLQLAPVAPGKGGAES